MKTCMAISLTSLAFVYLPFLASGQERMATAWNSQYLFAPRKNFHPRSTAGYDLTASGSNLKGGGTTSDSPATSLGVVVDTRGIYGVQINTKLHAQESFRLNLRTVAVYYPGRDGKFLFNRAEKHVAPWMASMATAEGEWTNQRITWTLGAGILDTYCADKLQQWVFGDGHDGDKSGPEPFITTQASVSIPISGRLTLRPEVTLVFNNSGLIRRTEFTVSAPFNPNLNLVYHL